MSTKEKSPRPPLETGAERVAPSWSTSREVVDTALELQAEADREAEVRARTAEMAEAAREVGLDPAQLAEAEALVAMRREELARREAKALQTRRQFLLAGAAAVVFAGAAATGWWLFAPAPFAPWAAAFTKAEWKLELNPGSTGGVAYVTEGGHGAVAAVEVKAFAPMEDGRYWANLDAKGLPGWEGAETVSYSVRGQGLAKVRLYLEAGEERWRGPALPVGANWAQHTVSLSDFEHQVREGGEWRVTSAAPPEGIEVVSVKLGHWVNEPESTGMVWLSGLEVQ